MKTFIAVGLLLLCCSTARGDGHPPWQFWKNGQEKTPTEKVTDAAKRVVYGDEAQGLWTTLKEKAKDVETPGIRWDLNPQRTVLKLRKRFSPLGLTKLCVGADFDPRDRSWKLQTSWVDRIIGGDINLQGTEVSVTKDFALDTRSSLWLRTAYDWKTKKSLIGFKLKPIQGLSQGPGDTPSLYFRKPFSINDNLKIEIGAALGLPEAAYTMGSDGKMSLGVGDFFVDLSDLNLILEI
mmetsp:Transcript_26221/g.62354  ORF Transcript_26221/g.62354 Transcript_26221/m.62354 type:complete len:237 (+) Transcript_26221:36-746(+)